MLINAYQKIKTFKKVYKRNSNVKPIHFSNSKRRKENIVFFELNIKKASNPMTYMHYKSLAGKWLKRTRSLSLSSKKIIEEKNKN